MLVLPPIGVQLVARNRIYCPGTAGGFFGAETVLGGQNLKSHDDEPVFEFISVRTPQKL